MKLELAPLAGFTDAPFRRLCVEGGADFAYTEMVSAAGLAHGNAPTRQLMDRMEGEGKLGLQLFGAKEEDFAKAMEGLPTYFEEVNLNAGCPMSKVTREGAGAKLMEKPELIYRILKIIVGATNSPVSLKTRLGPHPQKTNIFEIADAAYQAGAKKLIVHARYTSQMHGGEVGLERLAEVAERAKLPVIGNGSVCDLKSLKAMAATGVKGVMIGRAALNRPYIFSLLKGENAEAPISLPRRHLEYLIQYHEQMVRRYPKAHLPSLDAFVSVKMHVHLFRYFNGKPGAAALRARLNQVRSLAEINEIMAKYE